MFSFSSPRDSAGLTTSTAVDPSASPESSLGATWEVRGGNESPQEEPLTPHRGGGGDAFGFGCVGANLTELVLAPFMPFVAEPAVALRCREACLDDEADGGHLLRLLDCYARDPMGINESLPQRIMDSLLPKLQKLSYCKVYFAMFDDCIPIAMAICFEGFSTFQAAAVLNVHDFIVDPAYRGQKVGQRLMDHIAADCSRKGFCKITLEVLSGNSVALECYQKSGFHPYKLREETGDAMFLTRKLNIGFFDGYIPFT